MGFFDVRGIQVRGTERQKTAIHPRAKQAEEIAAPALPATKL